MYQTIKMLNKRICIYAKDVQLITGRTERYGRKLLEKIRKQLKKEDHQLVTIQEFCDYTGLPLEEIEKYV